MYKCINKIQWFAEKQKKELRGSWKSSVLAQLLMCSLRSQRAVGTFTGKDFFFFAPFFDVENRTQERHYEFARVAMQTAIDAFNARSVPVVLQLGDLLDGQCKDTDPHKVLSWLLSDWSKCTASKILHAVGNHELYCFEKDEAAKLFGLSAWNYAMSPAAGWKIIVCDSYGLSTLDKVSSCSLDFFCFNPKTCRRQRRKPTPFWWTTIPTTCAAAWWTGWRG